jgi:hypothetical protein
VIKNITLSAEERLIAAARERAQHERTTLNSAFRDWLQRYAARESASKRFEELMRKYKHISAGRHFSRDELNER